jgi:hypothetical protein
MKIYIVNILPNTLTNKLPKIIEEFGLPEEKIKYELYSKEFGIHIIDNNSIYNNETKFETDFELIKGYNNLDLLVDKTNYKHYETVSQLPVDYICTIIFELKFKFHKKSNLSFIIECIEETVNFEKKYIPINYYFDYEDKKLDLNNSFFKEDFNRFLSHLTNI